MNLMLRLERALDRIQTRLKWTPANWVMGYLCMALEAHRLRRELRSVEGAIAELMMELTRYHIVHEVGCTCRGCRILARYRALIPRARDFKNCQPDCDFQCATTLTPLVCLACGRDLGCSREEQTMKCTDCRGRQ